MPSQKTERLNLRLSAEALGRIRRAADRRQQDLTSFVLGAALEKCDDILGLKPEPLLLTQDERERLQELVASKEVPEGLLELIARK